MKSATIVALLTAPFVVGTTRVSWDPVYDQGTQSLSTVACSDGSNGLLPYYEFEDLPTFPNVGGSSVVAAWGSPNCGSCWNITYQSWSIIVTVIDRAEDGFNLSEEAMNTLTNGQATTLGAVDATADQVDESYCGLA